MSKITQRELASHLGLSYATVSRVFNGDTRVKEPTRQRVISEADRLGFRGHSLARALRLKRSMAIGVVVVNSPHSFWIDVLASMEKRAREAGYHVIICHRHSGSASSDEIRFLLDRQVDALILAPHPRYEDPSVLRDIVETGTPLLQINNRLPDFPGHYLGTDSRAGSRRICEYLLSLGHRRIAFIAGAEGDYSAESRLTGYREAMRSAGIPEWEQTVVGAGWSREEGEVAARTLLAQSRRPTAIMASNDPLAIGAYVELRRAGVRIPDDVSLVGYSGDRTSELLAVPLTTVVQPVERLGERAAEIVLDLIEGGSDRPLFEELQDELVIRESCAPPNAAVPGGSAG